MSKKNRKLRSWLFEVEAPFPKDNSLSRASAPAVATMMPQNVSLDQKVDRFFIQYERESIPTIQLVPAQQVPTYPAMTEAFSKHSGSAKLFNMLFEQGPTGGEAPMPTDIPDEAPPDMPDLTDTGDEEGSDSESLEEPETPKININLFAERAARLITNFESLLNPQTVLINRAQAYIARNYNENTAKELMIVLETQYGLTPKTERDQQAEQPETPIAAGGAGEPGSGAGGGGA